MKVALIHDHLAQDGGAERVLRVFAKMFPEAPIYTLLCEKDNINKNYFGKKIKSSIIQRLPGGVKHYQWYLPFMPIAVEFFDLSDYDLVLSDTSSFAKGVITRPDTLHICYCHTPTRYLWSDTHQYINDLKYNKYFKKIIAMVLNYIRIWDRQAAERVDSYIVNSYFVAKRLKKYYYRESSVIYPPIDIGRFYITEKIGDYFLAGSRLVTYKKLDLVIAAFNQLKDQNFKLKIFGSGPHEKELKILAKDNHNIEFVGRVDDPTLGKFYSECLAFIHPQEEDFGITAVEAMASGRPVIAYEKGGALETVISQKTGIFFNDQTEHSLMRAILDFNPNHFDAQVIRAHAEKFSEARFIKEINEFIDFEYEKFNNG